jgi:catechol 2,3-dioxygenase-like lactoylglutathione lyase family enzyme
MPVTGLDHVNLRCRESDLPALRRFWGEVIGLNEGFRPAFNFPGIWFWQGDRAVVHIAARLPDDAPLPPATGIFGHVALRAEGVEEVRARLKSLGVEWREAPVPGLPLHQIFLEDPTGATVELTFDMEADGVPAEPG